MEMCICLYADIFKDHELVKHQKSKLMLIFLIIKKHVFRWMLIQKKVKKIRSGRLNLTINYSKKENKIKIYGDNTDLLKFNVEISIECDRSDETKSFGVYEEKTKVFQFKIQSPKSCWKQISSIKMALHYFRYFYFFTFLLLGAYCSLFGVHNIKLTLRIIGFAIGFYTSFTFMAIIFYECFFKSNGIDFCVFVNCFIDCFWGFNRKFDKTFRRKAKLHLQFFKKCFLLF